jgi:hypothetical protein
MNAFRSVSMGFAGSGSQRGESFFRSRILASAHDLVPLLDFLLRQMARIEQIGLRRVAQIFARTAFAVV